MNTKNKKDDTKMMSTGLAPDYEEQPSAFGMTNDQRPLTIEDDGLPSSDIILLKIDPVYMVTRLGVQLDEASAKINEIAKHIACGVLMQGYLLNEIKAQSPGKWGARCGKKGDIPMCQTRANQIIGCLLEMWRRAEAAKRGETFLHQLRAAVEAYRENPNVIPTLPVLDELEIENWVSVHGMMITLGVINAKKKVHAIPDETQDKSKPAANSAEALDSQKNLHWSTASKMLDSFHYFMQQDAGNLNKQQRSELREQLHELLAELDRLEATAPALM